MSRTVALIAAAVTVVLVAVASRYGYHRDELYFLACARHLDWAYADQGPLTPLIARAMSEIAPDSLTLLRLPSAFAAGGTVFLTGLLARELGGTRRAQAIAAACAAVSVIFLFTGHLLSTTTFDLLAWTAVTWLVVRALRREDDRLWLVAGVVLGVGLLNKPLPAFLAAGLLAGVLIAGPPRLLRNRYVWGGALVALVIWSPWIVWQADHGWPQLDVSRTIAGGGSASSEAWWAIVPFQFLLVSPVLAPVWIAGLVSLFRGPRELRFLAWAWVVLAVVFMASGGKPYYLAGLLPVLLAAGALQADNWLGKRVARRASLGAAIALSAAVSAVIALPLLPAGEADPVLAVNEDVGETIGWPQLARQVTAIPHNAVIFAANYGEAGAVERFTDRRAYSGHNAYSDWGPPPDTQSGPVVTIGLDPDIVRKHFTACALAGRVESPVDNDEDGAPLMICASPLRPWSEEWPHLRHLG